MGKIASIAEFFSKNKQYLGFVNLPQSLFMTVKEVFDNALDVLEETEIENPEVQLKVREIKKNVWEVICLDNGYGIPENKIPLVFCKFLYSSKFSSKKMTRGELGVGLTGAVLYSQQSTGNPVVVISKTKNTDPVLYKLMIDVKKNEPVIVEKKKVEWNIEHGTCVRLVVKGSWNSRIDEYVKRSAKVNPHVKIVYNGYVYNPKPDLSKKPRVHEIPKCPTDYDYLEFKEFLLNSKNTLAVTLYRHFKGLGWVRAKDIERKIGKKYVEDLTEDDIKSIYAMLQEFKLRLRKEEIHNSVCGFGKEIIEEYLKEYNPEKIFISVSEPELWKSDVYMVEVGLAYGAKIDSDIEVHRFANRVPLLYAQGECVMYKSVNEVNWKYYKAKEKMLFLVHVVSTHVPYCETSKHAVAEVPIIKEKIMKCLRSIGREIKIWEGYKAKEKYLKKLKEDYEKLGELLKEIE